MSDALQKHITQFEADLTKLTKKHKLRFETTIVFPDYIELPEEVKLAMIIIKKHGGVIRPLYTRLH